jgi:hypothetical protein
VYSAKVQGKATTFGTSGMLYRSNKLMYDRATNTLWNQFIGEPVIGPLAESGRTLDFFPSELTTWGEWLECHPDTTIISPDTGVYPVAFYLPESNERAIYYEYRNSETTMFPVWSRDDTLAARDFVLGLELNGETKAYPAATTRAERVTNDTVAGTPIVVIGAASFEAALVYERGADTFALDAANDGSLPSVLLDANGGRWLVTNEALVSKANARLTLPRIATVTSFWHGWFSFHQTRRSTSARCSPHGRSPSGRQTTIATPEAHPHSVLNGRIPVREAIIDRDVRAVFSSAQQSERGHSPANGDPLQHRAEADCERDP